MTKAIKVILTFCILAILPACSSAVSYTYRPLAAEGCTVTYSIAKQDTMYSIVAKVKSDRMIFLNKPVMKIKTFNDEYLELQGEVLSGRNSSYLVNISNIYMPIESILAIAQFSITPEQLESLQNGIAKIRLPMHPVNHERTFRKDKIGKKLHQLYLIAKEKDDDFN